MASLPSTVPYSAVRARHASSQLIQLLTCIHRSEIRRRGFRLHGDSWHHYQRQDLCRMFAPNSLREKCFGWPCNTKLTIVRVTLVIREQSSVSREELSLCPSTTSLKMKVRWISCPSRASVSILICPVSIGEKARICAAGGFVDFGRVNGNLALSRAIGDFEFKKSADLPPEQQIVTAFPDVTVHDMTDDDEFVVLACDGELDCLCPVADSQLTIVYRHLGLPIFASSDRVCSSRHRVEAGADCHLREHDGQLLGFKQRDGRCRLRQHDHHDCRTSERQDQGRVVPDDRRQSGSRRRALRPPRIRSVFLITPL